jgi:hypothetical protein
LVRWNPTQKKIAQRISVATNTEKHQQQQQQQQQQPAPPNKKTIEIKRFEKIKTKEKLQHHKSSDFFSHLQKRSLSPFLMIYEIPFHLLVNILQRLTLDF